jgi:hypothetical protein
LALRTHACIFLCFLLQVVLLDSHLVTTLQQLVQLFCERIALSEDAAAVVEDMGDSSTAAPLELLFGDCLCTTFNILLALTNENGALCFCIGLRSTFGAAVWIL